jgi:formylglycine-generating enzyme required for sulfatase activity
MKFVTIGPGTFRMGSDSGEADEKPVHEVTLSQGFYLQTTEVTQAQWQAVMGNNPSFFKGPDRPVENVSWDDVQEFLGKLNAREKDTRYRLPTEAEWEYACRAAGRQ